MIRKLNRHVKERGVVGTAKRLKKCWNENGFEYTVLQMFKPVQNIHLPDSVSVTSYDAPGAEVKPQQTVADNILSQRIEPRPSALRKYSLSSFDTIIDLRLPGCKGIFVQGAVIDWEIPLFQRPQHMAIAMAKAGYLVFYITYQCNDDVNGFVEVYPNVFVTNKIDIPFVVKGAYISIYSTSPIYTPEQMSQIREHNKIIYEYIDHIDEKISGENTPQLAKLYDYISNDTIDIVAVSGRVLIEDIRPKVAEEKIVYVPNGVEFEHYQSAISMHGEAPEILRHIIARQKPIVGYFGAMAPWLWYDLIEEVTVKMPHYEFVFIGPDYYGGVGKLPKHENFNYLGIVDYKTLPNVAKYFDVAIIPFSPGQIAKTTSPLKLFEYFALQIPVVVTSEMQECVAFEEVLSGDSADSFIAQVKKAYSMKNDENFRKDLLKRAKENSWEKRAISLVEKIQSQENKEANTNSEIITEKITMQNEKKNFESNLLIESTSNTFGVSKLFVKELLTNNQISEELWDLEYQDFYNTLSPLQKMYLGFSLSTVTRGQAAYNILAPFLGNYERKRYLDVGCGYGGFLKVFHENGFHCMGVEINATLHHYSTLNLEGLDNCTVVNQDFFETETNQEPFSVITCNDVIEHVEDPVRAINKMCAMLQPKGLLMMEIPNRNAVNFVASDGHFQMFGITPLNRFEAGEYYRQFHKLDTTTGYYGGMGEYYPLEYYTNILKENQMQVTILDIHVIGTVATLPQLINDLVSSYGKWKETTAPTLTPMLSELIEVKFSNYLSVLMADYSQYLNSKDRVSFNRKYFLNFWTIIAVKD